MGNNKKDFVSIPRGLRDIMPTEVEERRYVETKLRRIFESWGYREIITPTFEFFDNLAIETGKMMKDEMFKFLDCDGSLLALRPEMTTPIARVVSQRMKSTDFSRLYYSTNVFREEPPQRGQQREFYQMGLEFIGSKGAAADAEVIAVLIESLRAAGLKDFRVGIGQADFFRGVLEESNISKELIKEIQTLLVEKDLVGIERLIVENSILSKDKSKIMEIPLLRGRENVLEKAKSYIGSACSRKVLKNLFDLYEFLKSYGLEEFVIFDFGIAKHFDYYTGIVFEVYAPNLGFLVGAGGRYDGLLSEFGVNKPACGFALGLERLHICLAEQGALKKQNSKRVLVCSTKDVKRVLATAKMLRDMDFCVETILEPYSFDKYDFATNEGEFRWVINVDKVPESVEIFDVETNLKKTSSLSMIKEKLK